MAERTLIPKSIEDAPSQSGEVLLYRLGPNRNIIEAKSRL